VTYLPVYLLVFLVYSS